MKERDGFVSNSSSSSFLIGLLRKPRSVEELKRWLFGDMDYLQWYDYGHKTIDIARRIFNDLKGKHPIRAKARLIREITAGSFPGYPDIWRKKRPSDKLEEQFSKSFPQYSSYWDNDKLKETMAKELAEKIRVARQKEWDEDNKAVEDSAERFLLKDVQPIMEGLHIYQLEYADGGDGPQGAVIEHGDVFNAIPHVQISKH